MVWEYTVLATRWKVKVKTVRKWENHIRVDLKWLYTKSLSALNKIAYLLYGILDFLS